MARAIATRCCSTPDSCDCRPSAQHRAVDFRELPDEIDGQADPGLAVHVIC